MNSMPPPSPAEADDRPADELTITTLETLKVFSDPLRQKIIEAVIDSARTVKQIAALLGLAPTKLYYHINLLEAHGLIRVVETRIVSGIIEKHYRASARNFAIQRTLLSPGSGGPSEGLRAALDAIFAPIRSEIEQGVTGGVIDTSNDAPAARKLRLWRAMNRMSPDDVEAFQARLEALVAEFERREPHPDPGTSAAAGPRYSLLIALYPTDGPQTAAESHE